MEDLMMRNILESMEDSLVVIDRQGEIVYTNKATERILGCNLDNLRADGLGATFFANDENYEFNQVIVDAIQEKSVHNYREVNYHHPDGSTRRLAATTSYLMDDTSSATRFIGFMAMFKDITEVFLLRRQEKHLIEERQKVLSEKAQSMQKLATGVAHEIRNPTVTIGGFAARLLRLDDVPKVVPDCADKILSGAQRLESLVEDVESYCDLGAPKLVKGNVVGVVKESVAQVAPTARSRNIDIKLRDDISRDTVSHFDPDLLRRAMVSLLQNSIDFSDKGSCVDIVVSATHEEIVIEVQDKGDGIRPEDMNYVFNPFFSTRADRPGMGLPTVRKIVHEHMGNLSVDSSRGLGTTVRVSLPRSPTP